MRWARRWFSAMVIDAREGVSNSIGASASAGYLANQAGNARSWITVYPCRSIALFSRRPLSWLEVHTGSLAGNAKDDTGPGFSAKMT
jgi:hypothetical protein